jgi:hypothetical protein
MFCLLFSRLTVGSCGSIYIFNVADSFSNYNEKGSLDCSFPFTAEPA